jgi:hypothetical protein
MHVRLRLHYEIFCLGSRSIVRRWSMGDGFRSVRTSMRFRALRG